MSNTPLTPLPDAARQHLLTTTLLQWFATHRRDLPWRKHYTPYATWIAEVMMQQTQMDRGVVYFNRWMACFPSIASVAKANDEALLKVWEGLGYYRRARNIKAAAQVIMEQYNGLFPSNYAAILALPGIGPYTAGAIASTAFNQAVPCVDGNVERVLSRVFDIDVSVKTNPGKAQLHQLATVLIPHGQARDFNQALMEFGALVCRKKPQCDVCPLCLHDPQMCESYRLGITHERPITKPRAAIIPLDVVTGVLLHHGKVFIQRREEEGVWGGLWEFPGGCVEANESPEQAIVREWQEELAFDVVPTTKDAVIRHGYTTYRITLHCFRLCFASPQPPEIAPTVLREATDYRWIDPACLGEVTLPAPHRKLADMLFAAAPDLPPTANTV